MKKKQLIILAVLMIVIVGGYLGVKSYNDLKTYRKQVADITVSNVNVSEIADGTYTGSYDVLWVAAEVKVTVKNHKIEEIELVKHENGRGASAEIIPGKVVEAQSLEVDIVSGATSSSKVILKAIENALNSAQK
ncbi:MAG: FMN-binding protein [Clostridia bacterium BRH_c25]|nr:MAG: FMN-binding protein [Clostridia bacterium BRH_c25]